MKLSTAGRLPSCSSITKKNEDYVSPNSGRKAFSSCVYVILFLLTYVILPLSKCSEFFRDNGANHDSHDEFKLEESKHESSSLTKIPKYGDNGAWLLFVKHFEEDWQDFNKDLTIKRDHWFEEKNVESEKLTKSMEDEKNKWFKAKDREVQILKKALEYKFASIDPSLRKPRKCSMSAKPPIEPIEPKEADDYVHNKNEAKDTKAVECAKNKEINKYPAEFNKKAQKTCTPQQRNCVKYKLQEKGEVIPNEEMQRPKTENPEMTKGPMEKPEMTKAPMEKPEMTKAPMEKPEMTKAPMRKVPVKREEMQPEELHSEDICTEEVPPKAIMQQKQLHPEEVPAEQVYQEGDHQGEMDPAEIQQSESMHQQQNIGQSGQAAYFPNKTPFVNVKYQSPQTPPQYQTEIPEHKECVAHKYEKDKVEDSKKTMPSKTLKDKNTITKPVGIGLSKKSTKDEEESKVLDGRDKMFKQWDKVVEYKLTTAKGDESKEENLEMLRKTQQMQDPSKGRVPSNISKKLCERKKKLNQKVEEQPQPQSKPQPQPQSKPQPQPQAKPQSKPQPKPQSKPQAKPPCMQMQKEVRKPKYKVPVVTAEHNRAYNAQQQKLKKTGQADVAVKGQPKKHKFTPSSQKVPRKSFKLEGEKINTVPQGVQQKCVIPKAPVKLQPSTEEQELGSHSIVIEEMIETESVTSDETVETESVLSAGEVTETKYVVGGKKTRIPRFVYSVKAKKDEVKLENESVLIEELTRTKSVVGREKPRIPTFVYSVKAKKDEENLETESVLSAGEATGTKCVVAGEKPRIPTFVYSKRNCIQRKHHL
ncbi:hypothetical protein AK88_01463 [Plasmodium fragile]|uniref:Tryptophan/threonine-rich plasmodium antigen C-terminal domain-containing protein n=1 Tax=Plasmodium fragile TaxID=5857 RepID=A0A0D9QPC7_PLAFR|nr:uncharacterized protein AK88_01463 [Plasmodium fragile]KJP88773.1 hypothetical protein AK88_01463 [Plasmodium fragile]